MSSAEQFAALAKNLPGNSDPPAPIATQREGKSFFTNPETGEIATPAEGTAALRRLIMLGAPDVQSPMHQFGYGCNFGAFRFGRGIFTR